MSHLVLASTPSLSCQSGGLPLRALPGKAPAENTGIERAGREFDRPTDPMDMVPSRMPAPNP